MMFNVQPRRYSVPTPIEHGRKVYVIRDVLSWDDLRFSGLCQYKTRRDDGCIVWKPCAEGVKFSEIEPFEVAA